MANSEFTNLNYGKVVHALGSLDKEKNPTAQSKGIVANINDFKGNIEFINNNITRNLVFFPSAIFANNQELNKYLLNFEIEFFESKKDVKAKNDLLHRDKAFLELV